VHLVRLSHITIILCLLNCVTDTIQVTEGCKYLAWGQHVGQPWLTERETHSNESK